MIYINIYIYIHKHTYTHNKPKYLVLLVYSFGNKEIKNSTHFLKYIRIHFRMAWFKSPAHGFEIFTLASWVRSKAGYQRTNGETLQHDQGTAGPIFPGTSDTTGCSKNMLWGYASARLFSFASFLKICKVKSLF